MNLSQYIKALQAIQQQCKREELGDPPMVMRRHSDYTDEVDPPVLASGLPRGDGRGWVMRAHNRMTVEDQARCMPFIEIVGGN
jgi:hypothetical protein